MVSTPPTELMAGYLVKRVQQALRRNCDAALRHTGLSMAQYVALRALADHPNASAAELARLCFVTRQTLQDVLSGLRTAGLVGPAPRPVSAPSRGRAKSLVVTAAGLDQLGAADSAIAEVEAAMTAGLSRSARDQLGALLIACAENLEAGAP